MKQHFIAPGDTYLLAHSVGPITHAAVQATQQYTLDWADLGGDAWPKWLKQIDQFRHLLGQLLHTEYSNICPQPSVSSGFTQWLSALATTSSNQRKLVVMHESAFPSLGFVVKGLESHGLQLRLVTGDINSAETWTRGMSGKDVLAVLFTHVHSNTGQLTDISALAKVVRSYDDIHIAVDVAQSVGVIPIDLQQWNVDAVFGSCVKWLSGGPGAGFMVVTHDLSALSPVHLGWFSHINPFEFDINRFIPATDALRFWGGTPSVQPYCAAAASIQVINMLDVNAIFRHVKRLQNTFITALDVDLGMNLNDSGGTLCIPVNNPDSDRIQQFLRTEQIQCDVRNGRLRLSFHPIHNEHDAENLAIRFNNWQII